MVAVKYVVVGVVVVIVVAAALVLLLPTQHQAPVQYVGSPSGYEGFVPSGQTVSYEGSQDPVGDLILNNGTTIPNVIWNGQYSGTIIQNHNEITQLNDQFVGQTDPVDYQTYVPLQDVYIIKGQVPIEQVTLNGQTYYVIEANKINPAYIAGFDTYQGWVDNLIAAMNIPGVIPAVLPGNSPVFTWANTTGTVAYQTMLYEHYYPYLNGRAVLILPNKTMIPYGTTDDVLGGMPLFNFTTPQQVLWYINSSFVPLPANSSPPS